GADRFGQYAQALPFLRPRLLQSEADRGKKCRPRPDLIQIGDALGPVGIVQVVERSLAERVGRAEARRMERIAFRLRWTAHVALQETPWGEAAKRHRGRKEERLPGNDLPGRPPVGTDLFGGLAREGGQPRHREGAAEILDELPPVEPRGLGENSRRI